LISEAENLTDPRNARQLREKFRNAGFAGKRDQELYQKFNAAMDKFFSTQKAEYASRGESARKLIAEIEELTAAPANAIARIREIREELRNLNCRETRSAEQQALRKFDMAFNESRKEEQRRREENSDTLTMNLAMAYEAWKNGDTPALPETESLAGFGKLQAIAKLLSEAISGDEKAAAKLDKQVNSAMEERERICAEMEKLSGSSSDTGIVDLAAELRSAMLGDFGKGSGNDRASHSADPQKLCMEFAAAGIVMPTELEKFQQRFAKAKAIVFAEK
jgi:hypothetical protein